MEELFAEVADEQGVVRVESPYGEAGAQQISQRGDAAGKIAYANVELPDDIEFTRAGEIRDDIEKDCPKIDGLRIELGGFIFAEFENPSSEVLGLAFAIVILIVAFGSVLAMGLPVGVALFGIGIGTAIITILSKLVTVPEFATFLGIMIGLGVGIDYALLIVTRYREQLHAGHTVRESITVAIDTAGRSVLFAGITVVISLLGMLLMGVTFVPGLAVSAAVVVASRSLASLTLLPALLGFAGSGSSSPAGAGLIAAGLVAVALVGVGLKITPLAALLPVAVIVLIVGLFCRAAQAGGRPPAAEAAARDRRLPLEPGHPAPAVAGRHRRHRRAPRPRHARARPAARLLRREQLRRGHHHQAGLRPAGRRLRRRLQRPDAARRRAARGHRHRRARPPSPRPPRPTPASCSSRRRSPTTRTTRPRCSGTSCPRPGRRTRPPPTSSTGCATTCCRRPSEAAGVEVAVTGTTAVNIDFSDYLAERLPYFFGAVLALSFLLLMVVFRSLLVPLKAVIMNLLSIGAAYGIVVALFQWGWLSDITGVQPAPIEPWAPMMLFAIVFGLSMDYEVFLLSRVREEWHRTGDSRTSVADGLAATAKVITAAAAIMVVVFGSFLLENDRVLKLMGTGLATAILLDATIVRMLLVPATMELLGDRNWWLPRWLDRILPNIDVEGHAEVTEGGDDEARKELAGAR